MTVVVQPSRLDSGPTKRARDVRFPENRNLVEGGRILVSQDTPSSILTRTYGPPVAGLVTNAPLLSGSNNGALVLDNFWPTAISVIPRGGYTEQMEVDKKVHYIFEHTDPVTTNFFLADGEGTIWEWNESSSSLSSSDAKITKQSSSDYSHLEVRTDGGSFILLANGADAMQVFSTTKAAPSEYSWNKIQTTKGSNEFYITGVDSSKLSYLWSYNNRVFAIEGNSLQAWYGGVNAFQGAFSKLPLGGVFNRGGTLMFGATWSGDSGEGLDDRCVFVTSQGEVAVFVGNPGNANKWNLQGVYEIGQPIHKHFHMNIGGDLIIGTRQGLIPMTLVIQKDPSQLSLASLTFAIADQWREQEFNDVDVSGWRMIKWDARNMLLVSLPDSDQREDTVFAMNMETGAWARFTGWNFTAMAVLQNNLYVADVDGKLGLGFRGGYDAGKSVNPGTKNNRPFICRLALPYDSLSSPAYDKHCSHIQSWWLTSGEFRLRHSMSVDFNTKFPDSNPANVHLVGRAAAGGETSEWDTSEWDEAFWSNEIASAGGVVHKWEAIPNIGKVLAVQVETVSESSGRLQAQLLSIHLAYKQHLDIGP